MGGHVIGELDVGCCYGAFSMFVGLKFRPK